MFRLTRRKKDRQTHTFPAYNRFKAADAADYRFKAAYIKCLKISFTK